MFFKFKSIILISKKLSYSQFNTTTPHHKVSTSLFQNNPLSSQTPNLFLGVSLPFHFISCAIFFVIFLFACNQAPNIFAKINRITTRPNPAITNNFLLFFRIHSNFFPRKYQGIDKNISRRTILPFVFGGLRYSHQAPLPSFLHHQIDRLFL